MNKSLRALIIDDEMQARAAVRGLLEENFPEVKIVAEAKDLPEGVKLIHQHAPDVVFLDIEMPGYSGLEILDFFGKNEIQFQLVFITAYNEYALNAFELSATDYLIKPLQQADMARAVNKLLQQVPQNLEALRKNLDPNEPKRVLINISGGQFFIELDHIIYIKADGSYSNIVLKNNEKHYVTKKLVEFERLQQIGNFMRIHRSHMININHMVKYSKNDGGIVVMSNGDELSVSQDKKQDLEDYIAGFKL